MRERIPILAVFLHPWYEDLTMVPAPDPRHEKNRHHLATAVFVLIVAPSLVIANFLWAQLQGLVVVQAIACAVVVVLRTIIIEAGVRRRVTQTEENFERGARSFFNCVFGFTLKEKSESREKTP